MGNGITKLLFLSPILFAETTLSMYAPIIALWLCFEYLQLTCAYAIFMSVDQKCTSLWRNLWKLLCMSVSNHYWPTILVLNNLCSCKVLSHVATRLFVTTDQWTHHKKGHATIPSQHKSVAISHYQSFFANHINLCVKLELLGKQLMIKLAWSYQDFEAMLSFLLVYLQLWQFLNQIYVKVALLL